MKIAPMLIIVTLVVAACAPIPQSAPDPRVDTRVDPRYPESAAENEIEGVITLSYNIAANGQTRNIRVVAADPPGYFEDAAIEALSQWRFETDGRAFSFEREFTQTFEFELDEAYQIIEPPPAP